VTLIPEVVVIFVPSGCTIYVGCELHINTYCLKKLTCIAPPLFLKSNNMVKQGRPLEKQGWCKIRCYFTQYFGGAFVMVFYRYVGISEVGRPGISSV
jgi:hypothetical protein